MASEAVADAEIAHKTQYGAIVEAAGLRDLLLDMARFNDFLFQRLAIQRYRFSIRYRGSLGVGSLLISILITPP